MDTMQEMKDDIGSDLVRIENKLRDKWGLSGVDRTSLFARDSSNDNMHIWLTNDQDVDLLVWRPGSEIPDSEGFVLAVLHVETNSPPPDYHAVIGYDHSAGRWDTGIVSFEATVVKWAHLPKLANE